MKLITPVILSGGAGSRLWPLSTAHKPKQFHVLHGKQSMFAATLARVSRHQFTGFGPPIVVCGANHEHQVLTELREGNEDQARLILEPMGRNTAPALAAAALAQADIDPDALMLVLPADHVILRPDQLRKACDDARDIAQDGGIVTFAIKPTSPETGYGYIKSCDALAPNVFEVAAFREKPDLATAQTYLDDGGYSWNAGMFFFKASALIDELTQFEPELVAKVRDALKDARRHDQVIALCAQAFGEARSISIDYAVMEQTKRAAVVPVDMGWSDVGSFATLWDLADRDGSGNGVRGPVALFDGTNNYVNSSDIPVALIGVSDLIVVATPNGVLVAHKDRAQDVRLAADAFKSRA